MDDDFKRYMIAGCFVLGAIASFTTYVLENVLIISLFISAFILFFLNSHSKIKYIAAILLLLNFIVYDSGSLPDDESDKANLISCLNSSAYREVFKDEQLDCSLYNRGKIVLLVKPFQICERNDNLICTRENSSLFFKKTAYEIGSISEFHDAFNKAKNDSFLSFLPWRASNICDLIDGLDYKHYKYCKDKPKINDYGIDIY